MTSDSYKQWSVSPAGNEGSREAGIPDGLVMDGPLGGVHGRCVCALWEVGVCQMGGGRVSDGRWACVRWEVGIYLMGGGHVYCSV